MNKSRKKFLGTYTLLFLIVSAAVFSFYYLEGRTFIWRSDGWIQQIRALIYNAQWLRTILKNLISGNFTIPQWDFALGEGGDIFAAMHFYAIGDPFNLLSVLVPASRMHDYFNLMALVRIWCAGLLFAALARELGIRNRYALLGGSLAYVFCHWNILFIGRHTYFLNLLVFLPLLLLGVEYCFKRKNPLMLSLAVFLAAVSQVYYFYFLTIFTALYALVRYFDLCRKGFFKEIGRVTLYALLGACMAGCILAPLAYLLLSDQRAAAGTTVPPFYALSYYAKLPGIFLSAYEDSYTWLCLAFAAPVLPALGRLIRRRREHRTLWVFTLVCLVITAFPFFGHALNCFSYVSNRWSFAAALVCCMILTVFWEDLSGSDTAERRKSLCFIGVWAVLCLLYPYNRRWDVIAALVIAVLFSLLPCLIRSDIWRNRLGIGLVCLSVFLNAAAYYTGEGPTYQNKLYKNFYNGFFANETEELLRAAKHQDDDDFFRYSGNDLSGNAGLLHHLSSTNYIWSLTNPNTMAFNEAMEINENITSIMYGFDNRPGLLSLAAVRYFTDRNGGKIPYGYFLHPESTYVYETENSLPLGYTYSEQITAEQWNAYDPAQKEEAMLRAVYLSGDQSDLTAFSGNLSSGALQFEMIPGNGIRIGENRFIVESSDNELTLRFTGEPRSETYFEIRGLEYARKDSFTLKERLFRDEPDHFDIRVGTEDGTRKSISYNTEYHLYPSRKNFIVNLDYREEAPQSITLSFSKPGIYAFESIAVLSRPMDGFREAVDTLRTNSLEKEQTETNRIRGTVHADQAGILCIAVPRSDGWKAFVDGAEQEILPANLKYMGLALTPGDHEIELRYHTPLFREGLILSALGWILFGISEVDRKSKRRTAAAETRSTSHETE